MMSNINCFAAISITKYFFQMLKPKLVLLAVIMLALYNEQNFHAVNGKAHQVHAEVKNGEIHLATPTKFLDRIELDPAGSSQDTEEAPAVGPFIGNLELVPPEISIKKRNCEMPSIVTRGMLGVGDLKRTYFALSPEELQTKIHEQAESDRKIKKRHVESADTVLPWTCETNYEWKDLGADHYPRFVRTAECRSKFCVRGFYRCKPRRYKTKILRRITDSQSNFCDSEDDVSLPLQLRTSWKFITVTINLCCDCTGPGRELI